MKRFTGIAPRVVLALALTGCSLLVGCQTPKVDPLAGIDESEAKSKGTRPRQAPGSDIPVKDAGRTARGVASFPTVNKLLELKANSGYPRREELEAILGDEGLLELHSALRDPEYYGERYFLLLVLALTDEPGRAFDAIRENAESYEGLPVERLPEDFDGYEFYMDKALSVSHLGELPKKLVSPYLRTIFSRDGAREALRAWPEATEDGGVVPAKEQLIRTLMDGVADAVSINGDEALVEEITRRQEALRTKCEDGQLPSDDIEFQYYTSCLIRRDIVESIGKDAWYNVLASGDVSQALHYIGLYREKYWPDVP